MSDDLNRKKDNASIECNMRTQPSEDKLKNLNNYNSSLETEKK